MYFFKIIVNENDSHLVEDIFEWALENRKNIIALTLFEYEIASIAKKKN